MIQACSRRLSPGTPPCGCAHVWPKHECHMRHAWSNAAHTIDSVIPAGCVAGGALVTKHRRWRLTNKAGAVAAVRGGGACPHTRDSWEPPWWRAPSRSITSGR
eukprot:7390936-Prymnesium_polylepis.1